MALFDAAVNGEALAGLGEPLSPGESTLSPQLTPAGAPPNKSQCDALQPLGPQCSWLRMTCHDSAKSGLGGRGGGWGGSRFLFVELQEEYVKHRLKGIETKRHNSPFETGR